MTTQSAQLMLCAYGRQYFGKLTGECYNTLDSKVCLVAPLPFVGALLVSLECRSVSLRVVPCSVLAWQVISQNQMKLNLSIEENAMKAALPHLTFKFL